MRTGIPSFALIVTIEQLSTCHCNVCLITMATRITACTSAMPDNARLSDTIYILIIDYLLAIR